MLADAARLAELDAAIADADATPGMPSVAMLEVHYLRAMTDGELTWITRTVEELKNKRLDWADAHTPEID